ncbi:D-alanyl-D-alanine carboxypeptidase family protein [Herbiconiux ginsengi]|uniref:D-alanyl-D-alanine carboxypeptidase (Penicillin-binding protein 5/6) n=1 Tax=Herbiconiux ginsengi TaxID=381665 RepID=A0A1H3PY16_9MICO|nr:D-alanyl-D-alanine carboxypeptidase [Herbiconiux ginsengi]SDZ05715.1 D-alanyl-D-alanine carboxypeptidase (penicillin-binding protein 5/6) [Herbiconiux ginsengi]
MSPTRAHYRRRRIVVGSLVVIVALLGTYLPVALLAPVPAATAVIPDAPAVSSTPVTLTTPGTGASAIAIAAGGGEVTALGTSGPADPLPIASIAKSVTALVVLDAKPIPEGGDGPEITITDADAAILQATIAVGGSWASVYPGQVLSERQVIEIMMLESANNYSVTLTDWAFGSTAAYLAAATSWLADHGLTDTSVVDTSGLDPGSRSSTRDLLAIASMVVADPVLGTIVGTASDQVPQLGEIENTNTLIGTSGIDGVKTGTTDEAGFCLLFSAEVAVGEQTVQLVGVVLGATGEDELHAAVLALLQSAQSGFQTLPLVSAGDVLGSYTTPWGATADIVAGGSLSETVWSQADVAREAEAQTLSSGASGTEVGTARYTVTGTTLGGSELTVPLTLSGELDGPDAWWRLTHPFR